MPRWLVVFDNAMGNQPLRDAHKDAHHAWLRAHAGHIRLAGATRDGLTGEFSGGAWLVEHDDREAVRRLAEDCPFFRVGVHTAYRLVWWGAAPGFEDVALGPPAR